MAGPSEPGLPDRKGAASTGRRWSSRQIGSPREEEGAIRSLWASGMPGIWCGDPREEEGVAAVSSAQGGGGAVRTVGPSGPMFGAAPPGRRRGVAAGPIGPREEEGPFVRR